MRYFYFTTEKEQN